VRTPARSRDDADVIRARLRALLADGQQRRGWVPDDVEPGDDPEDRYDDDPSESDGSRDDGGRDDGGPADLHRDARHRDDTALPAGLGRHRAPGPAARLDPGRPAAWALWAVAVLAAVAVLGWTWLDRPVVDQVPTTGTSTVVTDTPSGTAEAPGAPPATAEGTDGATGGTVVVSVVGQVAAPGLVTLPAGARVADALAAAGGLLPEADPASVNAAAVLSDGQQVAVGVPGAAPAAGAAAPAAGGVSDGPMDLNSATVADLDALPGIGPVLAQRIVDHRTAHGPFTSVDELDDVSGIGPAIFAELAARVRV
jgi:competence protein ComEA